MYGRYILITLSLLVLAGLVVLWVNDPLPKYNTATTVSVPDGLVLPGGDTVQAFVTTDKPDKVQTFFSSYFSHRWGWQQQYADVTCGASADNTIQPKFSFEFERFGKVVTVHGFTSEQAALKGFKDVPVGGTAFVVIAH